MNAGGRKVRLGLYLGGSQEKGAPEGRRGKGDGGDHLEALGRVGKMHRT